MLCFYPILYEAISIPVSGYSLFFGGGSWRRRLPERASLCAGEVVRRFLPDAIPARL